MNNLITIFKINNFYIIIKIITFLLLFILLFIFYMKNYKLQLNVFFIYKKKY